MKRWFAVMVAVAACSKAATMTEDQAYAAYEARREKALAFDKWAAMIKLERRKNPELQQQLDAGIEREVDNAGAYGAEVRFVDSTNNHLVGRVQLGACAVNDAVGKRDNVRVSDANAIRLATVSIGYGKYQSAYSVDGVARGDGSWNEGIHVRGGDKISPIITEWMLCFFTDGTPRPK